MQEREQLSLELITVEAAKQERASVIWLHGLGADGHDFVGIVDRFSPVIQDNVRFIFPSAPIQPVTINAGMSMRAWFDIYELSLNAKEDSAGMTASKNAVQVLIQQEIGRGIPERNIVVGGFSQGGAIALLTGFWGKYQLAGILGLSTYIPLEKEWLANIKPPYPPVFLAHGYFDPVVPFQLGQHMVEVLTNMKVNVEFKGYPMAHTVLPEEISEIERFLIRILNKVL